ncbi:MAG: substrate-binding domain-containing protein [Mollicutes bacterium]|nr:substrate-binding domain-containing protein [Mollicutes bacterium]MDY6069872.1 substrate-binding domain-containing protein [Bacilli bacterium]
MKKTLKTMILALAGLSLFSCGQEPTESSSKNVESTEPTSAFTPVELKSCGSTSVDKVITALGAKFADLTGNKVTLKKDQHGSGDATTGVTAGKNNTKYDIGFLSREIKDSEKTVLTEANKTGKMCKDAVVPIVNSANAYSATDKATLVAMYKGEKKTWKEVDSSLSGNIQLYSREAGSGTRECFFEGIGYGDVKAEDKWLDGVVVSSQASNGDMMNAIKAAPLGIGYCSLDSLATATGIKGLTFEGVTASEDAVNDGTYKLSRNFNYVIRGDYDATSERKIAVNAFVDFMSTKEGLATIKTAGGIVSNLATAPSWSSVQQSKYPALAK